MSRSDQAAEDLRALLSRANVAAGHLPDDDDQSNDAIIGRMFIAQRDFVRWLLEGERRYPAPPPEESRS